LLNLRHHVVRRSVHEEHTVKLITATGHDTAIGRAGFPALLITHAIVSHHDLLVAEQHASREWIGLADAPIRSCTSSTSRPRSERAAAGNTDLLDAEPKPFDASVLLSCVNGVFRRLKVMAA
jgi:hypothetical protein